MPTTTATPDTFRPFGSGEPPPGAWSCPVCGAAAPHEFRAGRKRVYCTNACRQKAYRWRRDHGVRLQVTPWTPARRSGAGRMHAVRPPTDPVGEPRDQRGRQAAVCGAFAYPAPPPLPGWHAEFVPGAARSCDSCTRLIGADPTWRERYPVVGPDARGFPCVYRPPELRRADYLAEVARLRGAA